MSKNPGPNKRNLDQTHQLFLSKAKAEFVEHGYANASTNRIVEETGMARGSLYYHFGDKKGLFIAVYKSMLVDMAETIKAAMDKKDTKWDAFLCGLECYLELCLMEERRRIILEAYNALRYEERMIIQRETLVGIMENLLFELVDDGYFKGHDPRILSLFIYGMVTETGRGLEVFPDPKAALPDILHSTRTMLTKMAQ